MKTAATHFTTAQSLQTRLVVASNETINKATTVVTEIYKTLHDRTGHEPSPYMKSGVGWDVGQLLNSEGIPAQQNPVRVFQDLGPRRICLHVLADMSCLLQWKSKGDRESRTLMWPFRLSPIFKHNGSEFTATTIHEQIVFHAGNGTRPFRAFTKDAAVDSPETKNVRKSFLASLKAEMIMIINAFDNALPIATGTDWLKDAIAHKAALPPLFSYVSTVRRGPDPDRFITELLSPYLRAVFPDMEEVSGFIYGRCISPDGAIGKPYAKIKIDGVEHPEIEEMVSDLLDSDMSPIPLDGQISQIGSVATAIGMLYIADLQKFSAHECFDAVVRMRALTASTKPAPTQAGIRALPTKERQTNAKGRHQL